MTFDVNNIPPQILLNASEVVQAAVSNYLSEHAVYTLSDTDLRQKMARSRLKSVMVKKNLLLVELDMF